MERFVAILMALVVALGSSRARSEPPAEVGAAWIRPENVYARAEALREELQAAQPDTAARAGLERIEKDFEELGRGVNAKLQRANVAVARSTPFVELDDLQRELATVGTSFAVWEEALAAEAKRSSDALDDMAQARRVWSETRNRPETVAADEVVKRHVEDTLEAVDTAAAALRAWRTRVLGVNDRIVDRHAAVDAVLKRLQDAIVAERTHLFVPGRPPLWQIAFRARLADQLPRVPQEIRAYAASTLAYVEGDPRPLVVQVLLAILLIAALRRLSGRPRDGLQQPLRAARLIERPYALAVLLVLLATPWLHPLAPQRFRQLLGMVALVPAARIVMQATDRASLATFAALFILFFTDRLALALAGLPEIARACSIASLVIGVSLAFWFARRVRRAGAVPWLRRTASFAVVGLAFALLAELGGWSNLATLLGRGIVASAVVGVYVYAAVLGLEPIVVHALSSPFVRRSHLLAHNVAGLQRGAARALRWLGAVFWLYLVLRAVGMQGTVVEAVGGLMRAGISVGALSLSVGGVLAFLLALVAAVLVARFTTVVLEEDVYPRTNLPRGVPFVLSTLVRYGIYSFGFLLALAAAGVRLDQLTIVLGGLGIGIGLGLQDLVKNFAAGLMLLLERRVHVGDVLEIPGRGISGRVLSIGLRATLVRAGNGSEVIVPNADLASGAITNWTLSDRLCQIQVPVGVAYGTDPERVTALLLDVAASLDQVLAEPRPQALFKSFGESSLDFVVSAWIDKGFDQQASVTSELALAVHRALVAAGITIPFPQRDVRLASVSPAVRAELAGRERKA